jgi:ABC-type polysaccharide/polyol phosphate transport system ATPase subunit
MWAVRFEGVSKFYRERSWYSSFGGELTNIRHNVAARLRREKLTRPGTLALDDLSFEVMAGESFALLGPNGSGKTTALRVLTGITFPTAGLVRARGRVGALMEAGAAIHPELTGRENVFLYGSILGLPRRELRTRYDEIVDFAEVERIIDRQVKYYSSGEQLRLGFSIASHLEPDIFAVDESLAVGDGNFQEKCVGRMRKLINGGTTVLFVSHFLPAVDALCNRAILLHRGTTLTQGPVKEVIQSYVDFLEDRRRNLAHAGWGTGPIRVIGASCHDKNGVERRQFEPHEPIEIRLHFEAERANGPVIDPLIVVGISDGRPQNLVECSMLDDEEHLWWEPVPQQWECRLMIDDLPLRPRLYHVRALVLDATGHAELFSWHDVATFTVTGVTSAEGLGLVAQAGGDVGIDARHRWEFLK